MAQIKWKVQFHKDFEPEFDKLHIEVQKKAYALMIALEAHGPEMRRPHVGVLKGSNYKNMKELRFEAQSGVWRVAFAFDPDRQAVLLVAGDKSGGSESRFYKRLIKKADERFARHLDAR